MRNVYDSNIGPVTMHETPAVETWVNPAPAMSKVSSTTTFNVVMNEMIAGASHRQDGRPGCMITIRPGINLVPEELIEHPYLRSHIAAGTVTLPDVDERPRAISKFLRDEPLPNPFETETQPMSPTSPSATQT